MTFWIIVGLIVWTMCILFMLAILKGGHRIRGHGYEQKLCFRSKVNTQNIEDSIKEVEKWSALVLHSIISKLKWRH